MKTIYHSDRAGKRGMIEIYLGGDTYAWVNKAKYLEWSNRPRRRGEKCPIGQLG